jgi:hypothetical protein
VGEKGLRSLITIVSGLPRSGTSLMMQMLAAGGMTLLTDHERKPDEDNPRGYYEWEPVKLLPKEPARIDEAEGKVVKVISQLLSFLPEGRSYRIIFMERPMAEVLASQDEMLRRRGKPDSVAHEVLTKAFREHLREVAALLEKRPDLRFYRVGYRRLLQDPRGIGQAISDFLELDLNVEAMAKQVDPTLYRNRSS